MVNMKGRWCLITGAARGIGYLTAKFMAAQGANLILHSRKRNSLKIKHFNILRAALMQHVNQASC